MRELLAAFAPIDGESGLPLLTAADGPGWTKLFDDVTANGSRTVRRLRVVNTHDTEALYLLVSPIGTDVSARSTSDGYLVRPADPPFDVPVLGTCSIWVNAATDTTWDAHVHDVIVPG